MIACALLSPNRIPDKVGSAGPGNRGDFWEATSMRALSMKTTAISVFGISIALGMAYATAWAATETPQSLADAAYKAMGMSDVKLAPAQIVNLITRGSMQAWDPGESESVGDPMKPDWGTSTFAQFWDRSRGLYRIEWDRPERMAKDGNTRKFSPMNMTTTWAAMSWASTSMADSRARDPGQQHAYPHGVGVEAGRDLTRIGTRQHRR